MAKKELADNKLSNFKLRAPRKIDRPAVLQLHLENGLNCTQIAQHQGVTPSAIAQFLRRYKGDTQLEEYKNARADVLARKQMRGHAIVDLLTEHLLMDDTAKLLPEVDKREWCKVLQGGGNYDHAQERLERGQSTSNVDMQQTLAWIRSVPLPDPE